MTEQISGARPSARPAQSWPAGRLPFVAVLAGVAVAAAVVTVLVRAVGVAAGADDTVPQLKLGVDIVFAAVGAVAAAAAWRRIRSRAADPARTLTVVVPSVLALSLVPDVLLGVTGTAWSAVVTLVAIHLAIGAAVVPLLARLVPVPARRA